MIISCDTEVGGVDLHHPGCRTFLVTICDDNGPIYWEWDVNPHTRQPEIPKGDLVEIQDVLSQADEIIFQHAKFDIRALSEIGVKWQEAWFDKVHDTLFSAHLLNSGLPKDLTSSALIYLKVDIRPLEDKLREACKEARKIVLREYKDWRIAREDDPDLPSAKDELWRWDYWLPRAVAKAEGYPEDHWWWTVASEYANGDSVVTRPLWFKHKELLEEKGLYEIYLERRKLIKIVYDMESKGVTCSFERINQMIEKFEEALQEDEAVCLGLSNGKLKSLPKSGTTKVMRELLFKDWNIPILKISKKTGEPSLDKVVLEQLEFSLPHNSKQLTFIKRLRSKRKKDTTVGYLRSYLRYGLPTKHEDIYVLHSSLNPTGQKTLRWSSSNPNEQNISKQEDDEGLTVRYCFGPGPGREWWALDYENIELRIPAYESGEKIMIEIFEKPDEPPYFGSYHLMNASIIYPDLFWPLADKKGAFKDKYKSTWYQWCKNFGFAVGYGAIPESGTADRAAHKPGAQRLVMDKLKEHSKLNQRMIDHANQYGYVETLPDKTVSPRGYPIYCPRSEWGKISPTVPLNYHVQSTAMNCMGKAMIRVSEYLKKLPGHFITMQVHDEIVIDMPKSRVPGGNLHKVLEIKRLMEMSGDDIGVPLKVSYSYHPHNWSEAADVPLLASAV